MQLSIRILRTDNSVEHSTVTAEDNQSIPSAIVVIGTKARKADPSICAIRVDGLPQYMWTGHHTDEHMRVIADRARNGTDNW